MAFPSDSGPARAMAAVIPADNAEFPLGPTRAVYVGSTGDLTVIGQDGQEVTFVSVPAGALLPIRASSVQTSSTAANIVGLW